MSFKDGIQYELYHNFTNEELVAITPAVIVCWMCLEVYGKSDHKTNNNPTQGRSSFINYAKKDISYYTTKRLMHCNEITNPPVVNYTKSIPVNVLIEIFKNKELQKEGKPLQTRNPFTEEEYKAATPKMDIHKNFESVFLCHQFLDFK